MRSKLKRIKWAAACAAIAAGTVSLVNCADSDTAQQSSSNGQLGSVQMKLNGVSALTLHSLDYTISGPAAYHNAGKIGVPASGSIQAVFSGLPVGAGYQITLSGTATDGLTTCSGSASFEVQARLTTSVTLHMECHEPSRTGSVLVNGTNVCPTLDDLNLMPTEAQVGSSVSLSATAHDRDQAPSALSYRWTANSGTFDDATSAKPKFTCAQAGSVAVSVSVSDGDNTANCPASSSLSVNCTAAGAAELNQLGHLVVIYLENHSFDNLYGSFPGAEGLASASANIPQTDFSTGQPYATLPQVDPNIPTTLVNKPFDITQFVPENQKTIDLVHRYYQEQQQIDNGKMDGFVSVSDAKGLSFGYYPTSTLPLVQLINTMPGQATVCDHFFHAAFGGSFLNHMWLIAARSPVFPGAPASAIARLDAQGNLIADGSVTPDGFVVNTSYSVNAPHPATAAAASLVPNQTFPTIGDRLNDAGVDWAWYAGGYGDALAGHPDPLFQFHHQPFVFFQSFADGTAAKAAHLKDEQDFLTAAAAGKLPPVSFVKPLGPNNEHPGYADLATGEQHVVELIKTLVNSPTWSDTAVIVTYDEHGGFWDHVAPPKVDRWGPGARVPTIVFSPFAKGGVDSTVYDTTAILTLIEKWWHLDPLTDRDAAQADLSSHALKFAP